MNAFLTFLCGLVITLVSALVVVIYLRAHLNAILIDLCGTAERAGFWTAFSSVTLILVPLIFALNYRPDDGPWTSLVFDLSGQLQNALIGLVCSVVVLGIVMSTFIRRREAAGTFEQGKPTA